MTNFPKSLTFPERLEALARRLYNLERRARPQARTDVVTTNGSGRGYISFPTSYVDAPIVTATGGNGESITMDAGGFPDPLGFGFYAYTQGGVPIVGNVRVYWIATPATGG